MTVAPANPKQGRGMIAQRQPLACLPVALPIKLAKGKQAKGGMAGTESNLAANISTINQKENFHHA